KVGYSALPQSLELLQIKRQGLWRNRVRNRRLARLARRFQAAEGQAIEKDFSAKGWGLLGVDPLAVAVLVENVEHAEMLAAYLPGWCVVAQDGWHSRCVGEDIHESKSAVESITGHQQGVIATVQGIEQLDWNGIDVLLRADGGVGLPPMTSFAQEQ